MCLILAAWRVSSEFPLVLAANRDEYHARPTQALHTWGDVPGLMAGRDSRAGGTWLGIDHGLRVAAITNLREPPGPRTGARSRGLLPVEFLSGDVGPAEWLRRIASNRTRYDGFNLVAGDSEELWFLNSRSEQPRAIAPGVHGVSNGDLDCDWPKVRKGRAGLERLLGHGTQDAQRLAESLFELLADRSVPPDPELPDTGIGVEWERRLAPAFVRAGEYGTRSSSVILVDERDGIRFIERSFDGNGVLAAETLCAWPPVGTGTAR